MQIVCAHDRAWRRSVESCVLQKWTQVGEGMQHWDKATISGREKGRWPWIAQETPRRGRRQNRPRDCLYRMQPKDVRPYGVGWVGVEQDLPLLHCHGCPPVLADRRQGR